MTTARSSEAFITPPTSVPVPAELPVRIAARLLDALVLAAVDLGLGQLLGYGFAWLFVGTAAVLTYFTVLDALAGASLGKLALGLRVVGPDGGRPTFRQALLRELCTIVGSVPFIGLPIALFVWTRLALQIRADSRRQGRHDLLAGGTRVVRAAAA